ncbi:metalloregulator ArsR/SmtB family transcription factor [Nocardiopsis exhalans]|uniref:Metalloregulator ArsR/SmtB family transcription factor n=1 Tax=Nocardiopsis exhalans TaxID=163604 RepID=A0ABY5D2L6_9ACTN|nr:metalloregulator ArsR/SmtB family transcription factor [Nocardiopsis exhalans]USY18569.1 metalloregulator ArsR/SmtB family transcription factor [Nocardiopsis exhalans]
MANDPLSLTFAALADPTRRAILARLAEGEATVNTLAEPFDISLQAVSKHLKVLERAGLITRGRDAQWRPCRLEAAPLEQVNEWVGRYRDRWEGRFARLDEELRRIQRGTGQSTGHGRDQGAGNESGADIQSSTEEEKTHE